MESPRRDGLDRPKASRYVVVTPHVSKYPDPIAFEAGDTLAPGRRDEKNPGWIRITCSDGNEGWAPEPLIRITGDGCGTALAAYTAFELETKSGDRVTASRAWDGWILVVNESGASGWVPEETLRPVPDRRAGFELAGVILAGLVHVVLESARGEAAALAFSALAALAYLAYYGIRIRRDPSLPARHGFLRDGFVPALRAHAPFTLTGAVALVGIGVARGAFPLPLSFWLLLAFYPVWGVAQQFALQKLLAGNIASLGNAGRFAALCRPVPLALVSAALFALAHAPRWDLAGLTLVAGFFFTLVHRRHPNLWAVGLAHGLLGALAVHLAIGVDPFGGWLR